MQLHRLCLRPCEVSAIPPLASGAILPLAGLLWALRAPAHLLALISACSLLVPRLIAWRYHGGSVVKVAPAPEPVLCSFIPVGTPWSPSLWKLGRAARGDSVHSLCFPALGEVRPMRSIAWWV